MSSEQLITVLVACISFGLLSMLHCAAMCGPLKNTFIKGASSSVLYHLGRLCSYGVIALFIHYFAVSPFVKVMERYSDIIMVCISIMIFTSLAIFLLKTYQKKSSLIMRKMFFYSNKLGSQAIKSFVYGAFTGLLPCSVLYAFLISLSMQEDIGVIILCVIVYTAITAIGVELSSSFLSFVTQRVRVNKRNIVIPMYLLSFFLILYRFYHAQFNGICFS